MRCGPRLAHRLVANPENVVLPCFCGHCLCSVRTGEAQSGGSNHMGEASSTHAQHFAKKLLQTQDAMYADGLLFGVFDGHSGTAASCRTRDVSARFACSLAYALTLTLIILQHSTRAQEAKSSFVQSCPKCTRLARCVCIDSCA